MARPRTLPDDEILEAALALIHGEGPEALTFARLSRACGLAPATLVQRFGTKTALKRRALLLSWDRLDARTAQLADAAPHTPEGAVLLLAGLSEEYGGIEFHADALLVLREDLRDPLLRERGAQWVRALSAALDRCLADALPDLEAPGLLVATWWQGAILLWSFEPNEPLADHVEMRLRDLLAALALPSPSP